MTKLIAVASLFTIAGCAGFAPPDYAPPKAGVIVTVDILMHTRFGPATLYSASPPADHFGTPAYLVQKILSLPEATSRKASIQVAANQTVHFVYVEPLQNTVRTCAFVFSFSTAPDITYYLDVGDFGRPDATTDAGKFDQWLFPLEGKDCTAQVKTKASDGSAINVPVQITNKTQQFILEAPKKGEMLPHPAWPQPTPAPPQLPR